jgi:hypothetical protein
MMGGGGREELAKAKQIYVQAKLKEKIFEQRECIAKKKP